MKRVIHSNYDACFITRRRWKRIVKPAWGRAPTVNEPPAAAPPPDRPIPLRRPLTVGPNRIDDRPPENIQSLPVTIE